MNVKLISSEQCSIIFYLMFITHNKNPAVKESSLKDANNKNYWKSYEEVVWIKTKFDQLWADVINFIVVITVWYC